MSQISQDIATNVQVIETANAQIKQMQLMLSQIHGMVYGKETKLTLNAWAHEIMDNNKNVHGYIIKSSLKRDLVANLTKVGHESISFSREQIAKRAAKIVELQGAIVTEQKRRQSADVVKRMYDVKQEYVEQFDDAEEGVEQFYSLISLVESLHITEEQLPEYGMTLNS